MNQTPAQLRNAAARRLMARKRFREALDMLNEAIRADPRFAESYENRAAVFDAMGMTPQAEADRRKVVELGGVKRPMPDEESAEPQPQPAKVRQRPAQLAIRYPNPAKRRGGGGSGAAMRAAGTILITLGLFVAAGIGIYIALSTISNAVNGDDNANQVINNSGTPTPLPSGETPAPSEGATPVPTPTHVPEPVDQALVGSPLSFPDAQAAWQAKGLTVTVGNPSTEVTGFATTAVDITLSKGGASLTVAVLFYDSAEELAADWSVGATVEPKTGSKPAGPSPWADHNAIVVMEADDQTIHADARDAFLGIP